MLIVKDKKLLFTKEVDILGKFFNTISSTFLKG
jgi:hypothetical protein